MPATTGNESSADTRASKLAFNSKAIELDSNAVGATS